uniref:Uncharacterized protein n=1 Tax=Kalanchoe fedtschenkoi TaxID=63787 RepID=A0A7N0TWV3_KALFE
MVFKVVVAHDPALYIQYNPPWGIGDNLSTELQMFGNHQKLAWRIIIFRTYSIPER